MDLGVTTGSPLPQTPASSALCADNSLLTHQFVVVGCCPEYSVRFPPRFTRGSMGCRTCFLPIFSEAAFFPDFFSLCMSPSRELKSSGMESRFRTYTFCCVCCHGCMGVYRVCPLSEQQRKRGGVRNRRPTLPKGAPWWMDFSPSAKKGKRNRKENKKTTTHRKKISIYIICPSYLKSIFFCPA